MRPNYIPVIIIGVLLLYVGIFGIEGLGLAWTSQSLPTTEPFNDLLGWSPYSSGGGRTPIINPAGQVELWGGPASSGQWDTRSSVSSSSGGPSAVLNIPQFTITIRMQFSTLGSTGQYAGMHQVQWYDFSWWWWISIEATGNIRFSNGDYPAIGTASWTPDTNWHTWTFLNTRSGTTSDSVYVYKDTLKITTLQSASVQGLNPKISLDTYNEAVVHIDEIKVLSGLVDPAQPTTGTLTVATTKDGAGLSGVSVSISGPTPKSGTTTDGSISWSDLSAGSYSVSGTYNSVTKPGVPSPVSVTAGGTATSSIDFTSTLPGTGTITVTCLDVYRTALPGIEVSVTRSGGPTTKQRTGSSGVATFVNLQYSSYTISATFNSEAKTDSKTISSTSPSAASTLQFSSEWTGPTWWDNFVIMLRGFVNKVRMPMEIFGGIITAIGAIMLILPAKSNTIRIAPRPV
jgi:hypothetical protein